MFCVVILDSTGVVCETGQDLTFSAKLLNEDRTLNTFIMLCFLRASPFCVGRYTLVQKHVVGQTLLRSWVQGKWRLGPSNIKIYKHLVCSSSVLLSTLLAKMPFTENL